MATSPTASCMVASNFAANAVSKQTTVSPSSRNFAGDFYAVGSVRVDELLVLLVNLFDGGEAVGVGRFAGGKAVFAADFFQGKLQVKALARRDFRPQRIDFLRIAIHQVEHERSKLDAWKCP